jgi:uncharacterized protein (TIGR02453 family)
MNSKTILAFLQELNENNNQEWFHSHKTEYIEAKQEFETFVNKLIPAIAEFDKGIKNITAKDCTYRIYRDIRFSKDKTPYKINMGAYMVKNGKKSNKAGYYFHLEPGGSLLAGGIYMPPPDVLKLVRSEIYYNVEEFKKIIYNKQFVKLFGELDNDKLVNAPKDFPKDFPDIDLLKYKNYTFIHKLSDKQMYSENLLEETISIFKMMYPFNSFMNRALE